jgi:hypothetical protein
VISDEGYMSTVKDDAILPAESSNTPERDAKNSHTKMRIQAMAVATKTA